MARVRVDAWRVGYRGLMSDEYLDEPDFANATEKDLRSWFNQLPEYVSVWVALAGSGIVGYCVDGPSPDQDADSSRGAIYDLFVESSSWRRGIGSALMSRATEDLIDAGFSEATLWVFDANTRARSFYESLGWATDGSERFDGGPTRTLPMVRYHREFNA